MIHIYVFDYNSDRLCHTTIPFPATNDVVETYLKRKFGLHADEIHFMTSYEPLEIEELKEL